MFAILLHDQLLQLLLIAIPHATPVTICMTIKALPVTDIVTEIDVVTVIADVSIYFKIVIDILSFFLF